MTDPPKQTFIAVPGSYRPHYDCHNTFARTLKKTPQGLWTNQVQLQNKEMGDLLVINPHPRLQPSNQPCIGLGMFRFWNVYHVAHDCSLFSRENGHTGCSWLLITIRTASGETFTSKKTDFVSHFFENSLIQKPIQSWDFHPAWTCWIITRPNLYRTGGWI